MILHISKLVNQRFTSVYQLGCAGWDIWERRDLIDLTNLNTNLIAAERMDSETLKCQFLFRPDAVSNPVPTAFIMACHIYFLFEISILLKLI